MKAIVHKQLDLAIEDKFLLDAAYTAAHANYSPVTRTLLREITPTITQGDQVDQRQGNKVKMKRMTMQIRMKMNAYNHIRTVGTVPWVSAENIFRDTGNVRVFVIRVVAELGTAVLPVVIEGAMASKYNLPGSFRQDYALSGGKSVMPGISVIGRTTLKKKWRTAICPVNDTGATPMQTHILNVPQYDHTYLNCKLDDEFTYTLGNNPIKHKYYVYAQFYDNWRNAVWDVPIAPAIFDIRNIWIYEDA